MKAKAWRLYGASDLRLEDVELESAGQDGVVVEIVANSVCVSDYKAVTLGAAHKRVPDDVATNPVMVGHEMVGIVCEVGEKWAYFMEASLYKDRYSVPMPTFGTSFWFRPEIFSYLYERGMTRGEIYRALKPKVCSTDDLKEVLINMYPERETLISQTFTLYGK